VSDQGGQDARPDQPGGSERPAEADWERRRRLAAVFGEVLPETTSDDRDPAADSGARESADDRWLRDQVPPHHGG
jgi:hypothetical protein